MVILTIGKSSEKRIVRHKAGENVNQNRCFKGWVSQTFDVYTEEQPKLLLTLNQLSTFNPQSYFTFYLSFLSPSSRHKSWKCSKAIPRQGVLTSVNLNLLEPATILALNVMDPQAVETALWRLVIGSAWGISPSLDIELVHFLVIISTGVFYFFLPIKRIWRR